MVESYRGRPSVTVTEPTESVVVCYWSVRECGRVLQRVTASGVVESYWSVTVLQTVTESYRESQSVTVLQTVTESYRV